MSNIAVQTTFGSLSTYVYPAGYDQTKLGLGPYMFQNNDSGNEGKWVGPMPITVVRPVEASGASAVGPPCAISWSSTYDWVFFADTSNALATRRFVLYTFNKTVTSNQWTFIGLIGCNIPFSGTQGTYTIRGFTVSYEKYTTGTVSINNGSASLTGSGTTWSADRIFIGSRIGFGSTDPALITTWYEISAIGGDTAITLTNNFAQSNISGSTYVIEDLRILWCATNATTASNGGLFMTAGLRFENFNPNNTAISAAATTDKVRATYWLSDGNTTNNATIQSCGGVAIDDKTDWTHQNVYVGNYPAALSQFQLSNFRAAMTVGGTTAGRDATTNTWTLNTGQQAVVGTVSQTNNLILCTPSHGPRSGVKSLFWVTTTKVYSAAISNLTTFSTTFQSGFMLDNPPGTINTFATSVYSLIWYSSLIDRFFISAAARIYCTQYREDFGQFDRMMLMNTGQINQSLVDATTTNWPSFLNVFYGCSKGNIVYIGNSGTATTTDFLYNTPFNADWEYASTTNCRVVLPVMDTSLFTSYTSAFMNVVEVLGGKTGYNLGMEPGAIRMYYRTSGISDNSGTWTLLDYSGDMSGVAIASSIQFMLEFRTLTWNGIPGRVTRVAVTGLSSASDSHFQFSQNLSSISSKQFVWRYSTAFGGTVPTLYVRLYNAVTGTLLVKDNSVTQVGTWEKSTDGSSWGSFNTTDRTNETTYFRFTPNSITDNITIQPTVRLS